MRLALFQPAIPQNDNTELRLGAQPGVFLGVIGALGTQARPENGESGRLGRALRLGAPLLGDQAQARITISVQQA